MPNLQTTMAAALAKAGANINASRLRIIADDAMAKHHGNADRAAKTLIREAQAADLLEELALYFLRNYRMPEADHGARDIQGTIVSDRQPNGDGEGHQVRDTLHNLAPLSPTNRGGEGQQVYDARTDFALPIREPSNEQREAQLKVRTQAAVSVFDRIKTARGVMWGNVYYMELQSMADDGDLARAVKSHIGQKRGAERQKPIRELMTPLQFHACLRKVGRVEHAA